MNFNSKYNYVVCGINIAFAFVGALAHNLLLLSIGIIFAIVNWYAGEDRRKVEEENYDKDNEEDQ